MVQKQKGALDYIKTVNSLPEADRMNAVWHYVLLDDNSFYAMSNAGADVKDMLDFCELTNAGIKGVLL